MKKLIFSVIFAICFAGCYPMYKVKSITTNMLEDKFIIKDTSSQHSKINQWLFMNVTSLEQSITYESRNVVSGKYYTILKPCKLFNENYKVVLNFQYFISNERGNFVVITKNPLLSYYTPTGIETRDAESTYIVKCNCDAEVESVMREFAKSLQKFLNK